MWTLAEWEAAALDVLTRTGRRLTAEQLLRRIRRRWKTAPRWPASWCDFVRALRLASKASPPRILRLRDRSPAGADGGWFRCGWVYAAADVLPAAGSVPERDPLERVRKLLAGARNVAPAGER